MSKHSVSISYVSDSQTLTLRNNLILRQCRLAPRFATVRYEYADCNKNLVEGNIHSPHISREASLTIDGKPICVGGCGDEGPLIYHEYTTERLDDGGTILHVFARGNGKELAKGLRLGLHYQLHADAPYLTKWLTLDNRGTEEVIVDNVCPEVLTMPMPPGALRMVEPTFMHRNARWRTRTNPLRYRYIDKNLALPCNAPLFFLDRHNQNLATGFSIVTDYVNIVEELGFAGSVGCIGGAVIASNGAASPPEVCVRYGVAPDMVVTPVSPFESFRVYECYCTGGYEDAALAFRQMLRQECPWIDRGLLTFQLCKDAPNVECRRSVDRASEVGFEFWKPAHSTMMEKHDGDPRVNTRFFPGGMAQLRSFVDYAHAKNLKVSAYVGFEWAIWDLKESALFRQHRWHLERDDGLPFPNRERPTAACLASGYGEYITQRCLEFVCAANLDGLDMDEPYHGWLCHSREHQHRSSANSQYMQWEVQRRFYKQLQSLGLPNDSPAALCAILHGNGPIPVGAEAWCVDAPDGDRGMERLYDVWDQVLAMRQDLWYSSYLLPPTAMRHSLSTWSALEHQTEASLDHWLATLLGYGVQSTFRGDLNEHNIPVFKKWVEWCKEYRAILESDIVHLSYPDGHSIDAIMHVNPAAEPPAFIVAYNPTSLRLRQTLTLPAKYLPS